MPVAVWNATVREKEAHLMDSLRTKANEVPKHVWISKMSGWVTFLSMNEARKQDWIAQEEDWSIISYQVLSE